MSVLTWLHSEARILEADVQKIYAAIVKGEQVAISDLEKSLSYINNSAPGIVSALASASAFVELLGPAVPQGAAVDVALKSAQALVTGLSAFSTQYTQATQGGGLSVAQAHAAIASGYNVLTTAKAAVEQIKAAATAPKAA
jgi:hypothetical protein